MAELNDPELATLAVRLLDLTSLNDTDDEATIDALCARALTPVGAVAAVCIYPRFIGFARRRLDALGAEAVRVATVANFPQGGVDVRRALEETRAAVADGADEVDLVYPYAALLAGDAQPGRDLVAACREACGDRALLKVILETGALAQPELICQASHDAIAAGAQFIKTSTGKVPVNATPEAASLMLGVIAEHGGAVGFKAAGGLRTLADARCYIELARATLGAQWVTPGHLRLGASGLLAELLKSLGEAGEAGTGADY